MSKTIFKMLLDEISFERNPPNFNDRIGNDGLRLFKAFEWTTDQDR